MVPLHEHHGRTVRWPMCSQQPTALPPDLQANDPLRFVAARAYRAAWHAAVAKGGDVADASQGARFPQAARARLGHWQMQRRQRLVAKYMACVQCQPGQLDFAQ